MKFLFTFALNCVLLVFITEAYTTHHASAAESLKELLKFKTILLNKLCIIKEKIQNLKCKERVIEFSNKLTKLHSLVDKVVSDYFEKLKTSYNGDITVEAHSLDLRKADYKGILKQANKLESRVDNALTDHHHPYHHKSCRCGHVSKYESKHGSEHKREHESDYGSKIGREHGSDYGSKHWSEHKREHESDYGSKIGREHGSDYGSKHGSKHGREHGSEYESDYGRKHGSKHGSKNCSKHGNKHGREHGREQGSEHGSEQWSEHRYGHETGRTKLSKIPSKYIVG